MALNAWARQVERDRMGDVDALHGQGMNGVGDDWSAVKHSERKDRPLPRDMVKELSQKSDVQGFFRMCMHCGAISPGR